MRMSHIHTDYRFQLTDSFPCWYSTNPSFCMMAWVLGLPSFKALRKWSSAWGSSCRDMRHRSGIVSRTPVVWRAEKPPVAETCNSPSVRAAERWVDTFPALAQAPALRCQCLMSPVTPATKKQWCIPGVYHIESTTPNTSLLPSWICTPPLDGPMTRRWWRDRELPRRHSVPMAECSLLVPIVP